MEDNREDETMSQETLKVSVIIPVYNDEKYLRECLDSVVNQTLKEIEIICVDDGSTDGSLAILREYEARDKRITVLTQPHTNAGAARNHGLRHATGEYLSFLDSDDFFESDMLETAYRRGKEQNAEIVVFHCNFYNESAQAFGSTIGALHEENLPECRPFSGKQVKRNIFGTFVGWAWDKLFLREYIAENQICFQEQRTTNDMLFTYFALAKAERITIEEKVLAHHRIHIFTSLQETRAESWMCFYEALCALRDALKNAGIFEHYERDFVNYCVGFSLWNLKTLPWPIQEELYNSLKLGWFENLGVLGHKQSFFYNKYDYFLLQHIMNDSYSEEPLQYKLIKALLGGAQCYRDHGAAYTLRRTLYHMGLWKDEENE